MTYDDMKFERELKHRLRDNEERGIVLNPLASMRDDDDGPSDITKKVIQGLDEVLDAYFYSIMGEDTDYDTIYDMTQNIISGLSDKELRKMCKHHRFTEDELNYMKYVSYVREWRGTNGMGYGTAYAIRDILLREHLIKSEGKDALPLLKRAAENLPNGIGLSKAKKYFSELFSDNPYGENIRERLDAALDEGTEKAFNDNINCGGYALRVDTWVSPPNQKSFEGMLACLLEKYPFIRLEDRGKISKDEYLVIYRANKEGMGHHFVRIDSDGVAREKDSKNPPRIFNGWGNLGDCKEAVFAVKKEHEMFGYHMLGANRSSNNVVIPAKVVEYINSTTRRVPQIEGGRLVNYSDYIQTSARRFRDDDDDAR